MGDAQRDPNAALVVTVAPSVDMYDGASDAKSFLRRIDQMRDTLKLSNQLTASLALMRLKHDSPVYIWYQNQVALGDLANLDIWLPEDAVAAGEEHITFGHMLIRESVGGSFERLHDVAVCSKRFVVLLVVV